MVKCSFDKEKKNEICAYEPKLLDSYIGEPFDFYGGNLKLSEIDIERTKKDYLYKSQELIIDQLKEQIEHLESQNEILLE